MLRVNPPRGEDVPTVRQPSPAAPFSLEGALALGLCAIVVLATLAILKRSSDYSRVLTELQADSLRMRPARPRPASAPARTEPRPELVVLVSLDGLRADRLELYGHARATAPSLRALGESGAVFTTVAAQSSQPLVSLKSLLTGKYPATLMLEETGADLYDLATVRAPEGYLTSTFTAVRGELAASFQANGFRTAAFTSGDWTGSARGFGTGFASLEEGAGLAENVTRALAWLDQKPGVPTFLFLQADALVCPFASEAETVLACPEHAEHAALGPLCSRAEAPALETAELAALADHYDAAVQAADAALGRLLDGLASRGLAERALIAVTSAHGMRLGERGTLGHGGLHPEELLVPLVLRFPAAWNLPPRRIDEPAELVDVLPTLQGLCGLVVPRELDGQSLVPTLLRGVHGRDFLVAQGLFVPGGERSSAAMRTLFLPGRWQLIQDNERAQASFFALDDDPLGLGGLPVAVDEFAPLLDLLLGSGGVPHTALRARAPVHLGAALLEELDELGYDAAALAGPGASSDLR